MRRPIHLLLAVLLLILGTAFAVGCGDDEEPSGESTAASEAPADEAEGQGDGSQDPGDGAQADPLTAAGIDPITGAYRGLEPDTREGTPPPPPPGSLEEAAEAAGCTLRLNLPDELEGVQEVHLAEGEGPPDYGTTPANSGRHDSVPIADGAYRKTPPEANVVHSLEHGRVAIQYSPALSDDVQLGLKGVFDADPDGTLLFPNPDMPYDVAVTAWTNLMGCRESSDAEALAAAVLAFQEQFRGKGPERIPL